MLIAGTTARLLRTSFSLLGMHRLAWKVRRLDFPVRSRHLVLDVGGGAKPNPYADVVLERDPEGGETNVGSARALGRVLVWGDAERMPFRNGSFDLALCFHVLEHVANPAACLTELQRVARAGYIETPNEIFDIVCPYVHHRNRVSFDGQVLRVLRKERWDIERFADRYGRRRVGEVIRALSRDPAALHVQYRWVDRISFVVEEEALAAPAGPADTSDVPSGHQRAVLNGLAALVIRKRRLTGERLLGLFRCIECGADSLEFAAGGSARCPRCGRLYPRVGGHLDFRP
jgi:ubiquinone/menaquinone biosynthesis C-methylase UbiE